MFAEEIQLGIVLYQYHKYIISMRVMYTHIIQTRFSSLARKTLFSIILVSGYVLI